VEELDWRRQLEHRMMELKNPIHNTANKDVQAGGILDVDRNSTDD
jgi:hypothetical protein